MEAPATMDDPAVLTTLAHSGLLLKQDKTLPNVVGLVVGESLSTSWWSPPKADVGFAVLSELSEHSDVLFTKLVAKKDTLLHRSCGPPSPPSSGCPPALSRLTPFAGRSRAC